MPMAMIIRDLVAFLITDVVAYLVAKKIFTSVPCLCQRYPLQSKRPEIERKPEKECSLCKVHKCRRRRCNAHVPGCKVCQANHAGDIYHFGTPGTFRKKRQDTYPYDKKIRIRFKTHNPQFPEIVRTAEVRYGHGDSLAHVSSQSDPDSPEMCNSEDERTSEQFISTGSEKNLSAASVGECSTHECILKRLGLDSNEKMNQCSKETKDFLRVYDSFLSTLSRFGKQSNEPDTVPSCDSSFDGREAESKPSPIHGVHNGYALGKYFQNFPFPANSDSSYTLAPYMTKIAVIYEMINYLRCRMHRLKDDEKDCLNFKANLIFKAMGYKVSEETEWEPIEKLAFLWAIVAPSHVSAEPFENFSKFFESLRGGFAGNLEDLTKEAQSIWDTFDFTERNPFILQAFIYRINSSNVSPSDSVVIKQVLKELFEEDLQSKTEN